MVARLATESELDSGVMDALRQQQPATQAPTTASAGGFDPSQGNQVIGGLMYQPIFDEYGNLQEVLRYQPGQIGAGQNYERLNPQTLQPTGTGQFQETAGIGTMLRETAQDFAPLAAMALGVNPALAAGLGGATAGALGIEGLSAAQLGALGSGVGATGIGLAQGKNPLEAIKTGLLTGATGMVPELASGLVPSTGNTALDSALKSAVASGTKAALQGQNVDEAVLGALTASGLGTATGIDPKVIGNAIKVITSGGDPQQIFNTVVSAAQSGVQAPTQSLPAYQDPSRQFDTASNQERYNALVSAFEQAASRPPSSRENDLLLAAADPRVIGLTPATVSDVATGVLAGPGAGLAKYLFDAKVRLERGEDPKASPYAQAITLPEADVKAIWGDKKPEPQLTTPQTSYKAPLFPVPDIRIDETPEERLTRLMTDLASQTATSGATSATGDVSSAADAATTASDQASKLSSSDLSTKVGGEALETGQLSENITPQSVMAYQNASNAGASDEAAKAAVESTTGPMSQLDWDNFKAAMGAATAPSTPGPSGVTAPTAAAPGGTTPTGTTPATNLTDQIVNLTTGGGTTGAGGGTSGATTANALSLPLGPEGPVGPPQGVNLTLPLGPEGPVGPNITNQILDLIANSAGTGSKTITGGTGSDTLTGGTGTSTLSGGTGTDSLTGGTGTSTLQGGTGTDSITGGTGTSTLGGGTGTDTLTGGKGTDTLTGGTGTDTGSGGPGTDTLVGSTGTDTGPGGLGTDTGPGSTGTDTGPGVTGIDTIVSTIEPPVITITPVIDPVISLIYDIYTTLPPVVTTTVAPPPPSTFIPPTTTNVVTTLPPTTTSLPPPPTTTVLPPPTTTVTQQPPTTTFLPPTTTFVPPTTTFLPPTTTGQPPTTTTVVTTTPGPTTTLETTTTVTTTVTTGITTTVTTRIDETTTTAEPTSLAPTTTSSYVFDPGTKDKVLTEALTAFTPTLFKGRVGTAYSRPAGEIESEVTGKKRRDVWNEASLRLKDALGL